MNIDSTTYENPIIVEGEIEKLQILRALIIDENVERIQEVTISKKGDKKSGIYISIESDIKAYFDQLQTLTTSWVLKEKFLNLSRSEIKALIIKRIDTVNLTLVHLPEKIFQYKTIRIEYQNRLIDVNEIHRKRWEYIIYKAVNYRDEYFASIVFTNSAADWSKILKLTEKEVKIVQSKKNALIDSMIIKKRKSNW